MSSYLGLVFFDLAVPGPPILLPSEYLAAPKFALHDNIVGDDFYKAFQWEAISDPTHGRVNYVDQTTARARNLTSATRGSFTIRADNKNVVSGFSRGRDSCRIKTYESYADSVIVIDVQHMPTGCGTWPAAWTLSKSSVWPNGGEVDIIEGVNKNSVNTVALHTAPGCMMPRRRRQTGNIVTTDCNALANDNSGCVTTFNKLATFGSAFNDNGGGWFVMKRTEHEGIHVWFWGRNDPAVPLEVRQGDPNIRPDDHWGIPESRNPSSDTCNFERYFDSHQVVINLTLCGDWAGNVFADSGCGAGMAACEELVNNRPEAFQEAYWEINALRIYTPTGEDRARAYKSSL